ncbi:MAG: hypothetical protein COA78_28520 [Blastopirellula sp.]|nr:MAG: hypothetical protein COA78_28520 [Blastopirellula sp.]
MKNIFIFITVFILTGCQFLVPDLAQDLEAVLGVAEGIDSDGNKEGENAVACTQITITRNGTFADVTTTHKRIEIPSGFNIDNIITVDDLERVESVLCDT